jgi:hypothetical protein
VAAFLTHLVVGERVWAQLDGRRPQAWASLWCTPAGERVERSGEPSSDGWRSSEEDYGSLFGCLAPDVDKLCAGLEQGVTHFLPMDESGIYCQIEADLPASERLVETMELESIVEEAVDHSHQRICALLNGEC